MPELSCQRVRVYTAIYALVFLCVSAQIAAAAEKTFNFVVACHDLKSFRSQAELVARLKPYGHVQINISTLPEKSWYTIPEGGSAWHEYAAYNPTFFKYFPHPQVAPFIPADVVAAHRKLLLEKAAVVRELGLGASFWCYGVNFLPEAFFTAHPGLRGPRVDHPRRSTQEEFSLCVDLEENREMYRWSMEQLKKSVPELEMVLFKTNDAGGGLCWAEAQYAGPNGPRHCQNRNVGERMRDYCLALHQGARDGGGDVTLRIADSNFWRNEDLVLLSYLPENTFYDSHDPGAISISWGGSYPVLGMVNPLTVIAAMERYDNPAVERVDLATRYSYDRSTETDSALAKVIEIMEDCIARPVRGQAGRLEKLKELSARWGGQSGAETVFEAFSLMDRAFALKNAAAPRYTTQYNGVSARHITRPLLIKPELLAPEEESYFLPFVFNPRLEEARQDYIDIHGGRLQGPAEWNNPALSGALSQALRAASLLESVKDAPEAGWLRSQALCLRLWASFLRSTHNFYHGQLIRDKYKDILNGPKRIPAKIASWEGDPGNLEWNAILRDEFDNTNELIALLKTNGLSHVALAPDARHEDTFILGPDLPVQLEKKARIMRAHWLDVQDWLAPPHK